MNEQKAKAQRALQHYHEKEVQELVRLSADHKMSTPRAGCEEKHRIHRARADALFWLMEVIENIGEEV